MGRSVSYPRGSEVVTLSELPHFRESYETLWTINPLLIPGSLYTPKTGAAE